MSTQSMLKLISERDCMAECLKKIAAELEATHARLGRAHDNYHANNPKDHDGISIRKGKQQGVGLAIHIVQRALAGPLTNET